MIGRENKKEDEMTNENVTDVQMGGLGTRLAFQNLCFDMTNLTNHIQYC